MKLTKCIIIIFLLLVISVNSVFADSVGIMIDGVSVTFTDSTGYTFIDENGRTMVPLRAAMEAFGAKVNWDPNTKTAYVEKDKMVVSATIGKKYISRNGEVVNNDAAAVIRNGKTYLPIRVVLESFGAIVDWDSKSKSVIVDSQKNSGIVYAIENRKESSSNFWKDYADAVALKDAKNYSAAISKFELVAPNFLKENNPTNMALLFSNIGECYANLKEYDKASACWIREGFYWDKAGKSQETIAALRKSDNIKSEVILYANTRDKSKNLVKYFNAPLEPKIGILLGAYAEMDKAVHDPSSMEKFYMNEFPKLVGKDHAAYLIYFTYGMDLSSYISHIEVAREKNKIIELALQPLKGLDSVNAEDGYLVKLAKDMEKSGAKFMLRFANEMNDPTSTWYTTDYNKYISKFRIVSKIFKEHAPSVAIVWAPNFFPPDTIANYYPGDEYVDYVGISSYQNYAPNLDPLKQGVDRSRWSAQLDTIYSLYGDRKPIIISEGGVSYIARSTGENITNYASKQLKDFYTYLPIKYPNVKAVFYYGATNLPSKYILSENPMMLNTYSEVIKNDYYLSDYNGAGTVDTYYYPIASNKISPSLQELCSYIKYVEDTKISRVEYKVNNEIVGNSYDIPYKVNCDFSKYSGQAVIITVNAYDSNSNLLVSRKFTAKVE